MIIPMESHRPDAADIHAPRSLGVLAFQTVLGFPPIALAAAFLLVATTSWGHLTPQDRLILLTITLLCLIFGSLLVYVPQRYIPRVLITRECNHLQRVGNHQVVQEHDLGAVTHLVSKRIKTAPGMSYELILHKIDGQAIVLFDEDPMFGGSHWQQFAERLSTAAGKALMTEYWVEAYDGTLLSIPQGHLAAGRKRGLLILSVPIAVSCVAAGIFGTILTQRSFVVFGCASVFVNLALSFYYVFSHRRQFGDLLHSVIVIAAVLTLSISYGTVYVFLAFLFLGLRTLMRI